MNILPNEAQPRKPETLKRSLLTAIDGSSYRVTRIAELSRGSYTNSLPPTYERGHVTPIVENSVHQIGGNLLKHWVLSALSSVCEGRVKPFCGIDSWELEKFTSITAWSRELLYYYSVPAKLCPVTDCSLNNLLIVPDFAYELAIENRGKPKTMKKQ